MKVLAVWELAIPLPAVMLIVASLYMILLGTGLWIRHCLKDRCSSDCTDCCPRVSLCEQCYRLAETCNYRMPTIRSFLPNSCCSPSCANMDCSCACQPPACEDFSCFCLEIRIK
ncbi:keratin-associated protein 5-4 [Cololabis saira]|uniref:keratin-associated protein 5-4 n=1 Tax=Cololabis saira TaxID=129043 RepID=UPI002AD3E780|nr:keratin-associated protein 5-4 [Cololabis saira]